MEKSGRRKGRAIGEMRESRGGTREVEGVEEMSRVMRGIIEGEEKGRNKGK